MSRYSALTIIGLGLVSIICCNSSHIQNSGNDVYFRMTGIIKLEKNKPLRFCGNLLVELMTEVCGHYGYNKRSYNSDNEHTEEIIQGLPNEDNFLAKMFGHKSEIFQRSTRNLNDECCVKRCTIEKMRTYCRQAPTEAPRMTSDPES